LNAAPGDTATRPGPADTFAAEAAALVRERSVVRPQVAVVSGSGLREAVEEHLEPDREISFQALPGFPPATVPGHAGRLVLGVLHGLPAVVFLGRVHLYEGHGIGATTLIPRLAAELGASTLILTNAAGGLRPSFHRGQLMLIEDHINSLGVNPLTGWRFPDGTPAFVELSRVYDPDLLALSEQVAAREGVTAARGVYVAMPGPTYETPAESEFLRRAGADAVGMSTVPEAVAGAALGMRVLGLSSITNVAGTAGTHEDVLEAGKAAAQGLSRVLAGVVPRLTT
jgi:purine-nucleoside phosphorylase